MKVQSPPEDEDEEEEEEEGWRGWVISHLSTYAFGFLTWGEGKNAITRL